MRTESFQPSRDGFAFANAFTDPGSQFGLGTAIAPAFGLGAGMAWAALDRYHAGRPVPRSTKPPAAPDPLLAELITRQSNALAVAPWTRIVEWQCLPDCGRWGQRGLAELSRAQWRETRRSLDVGLPVLLLLVVASGRHANPSMNKAVLAVGYELDRRARRVTMRVYDPARPGNDSVRVVFRLGGRFVPLAARLAVDTEVRGFFTVPYDRPIPASLALDVASDLDGRVIESVVAPLRGDRAGDPLHILAREGIAGLLHLRRDRRGRWSAVSLNGRSRGILGPNPDAHGIAVLGPERILARARTGELLEYRRLPALGWRARSITGSQRIGESFRIDGKPTALRDSQGRVTVIAGRNGKLVRYRRDRWSGWRADHLVEGLLGKTTFQGIAAVAELGRNVLHVLCRTDAGDLMHLRWRDKGGCVVENVTTRAGGRDRFAVSQDPIVLTDRAGKVLNVVARSNDGGVLLFRWTERRGWRGVALSVMAARDAGVDLRTADSALSAALDFEGTVHVVGRDTRGGLIHFWHTRHGATGGQEITCTGEASGERGTVDGPPILGAGPAEMLHVFARQGLDLLLCRWTPVGGWNTENVSREQNARGSTEVCGDLALMVTKHAVHAAFVDSSGRVQHVCAEVRPANRRSDFGRHLVAGIGDAVSAPLALVSSFRFDFTRLSSVVERATRRASVLATVLRNAARPAVSGMGARFLPSGARKSVFGQPPISASKKPAASRRAMPEPPAPAPVETHESAYHATGEVSSAIPVPVRQFTPEPVAHTETAPEASAPNDAANAARYDAWPAHERTEAAASVADELAACAASVVEGSASCDASLADESATNAATAEFAHALFAGPASEANPNLATASILELTLTPAPVLPPELAPVASELTSEAAPSAPAAAEDQPQPPAPSPMKTTAVPKPKRANPALEGLPLLGDDEESRPVAASAPADAVVAAPSSVAVRRKNRERDLLEMQRVMALAEESAPELLPTIGGK